MPAGTLNRKTSPATLAPRCLVRTPSHEEASARLQFVVEHGSRLGLLLGESGSGKTTLLESFHEELRGAGCLTAVVNVAGLEAQELLWSIAVKLRTPVEKEWNLFQLWRALNDRFTELRFLREQAVVLVDDAGLASTDVLMQIYRLAQSEPASEARLSIILGTTRAALPRIGRHLLELVDLKIELPAWSVAEARALVEATAGTGRAVRFSTTAMERLHRLSGGMPRMIVRLADLARLAAAADGGDTVDAETVEGVYDELSLHAAAS
ncbi:MAG: AAA family ATPase [Planctomycetia bacterium]|nr:AAA family ATPase [Planctomycetia bacterium]